MLTLNFYDSNGSEILNLTQWDLGQVVYVPKNDIETAPIFHFYNKLSEEAIPVESTISGTYFKVDVPNVLLKEAYHIGVTMVDYTDSTNAVTIGKGVICVIPKTKPASYEYVENIKNVFEEIATREVDNRLDEFEQTYLQHLDDGSPKGIFTSVAGLSGKENGIYIYNGTTNTSVSPQLKKGFIYFWNGTTISDPIIQYQAESIASGSVGYDALDETLQSAYDLFMSEDYIKVVKPRDAQDNVVTLTSATALDYPTYCDDYTMWHFQVADDLAELLGVTDDTVCRLSYIAPYQMIDVINTGVVITRKINQIVPNFNADNFTVINPNYTKSETDDLLSDKITIKKIMPFAPTTKATIDALTDLDDKTYYKVYLASGVLYNGSPAQIATLIQYTETTRHLICSMDGLYYCVKTNDVWGDFQPSISAGVITENMLSPALVMKALEENRVFANTAALNTYLATTYASAGQVVVVGEDGKYKLYVLQSDGNGGLTPVQASAGCYIGTALPAEGDSDLDYYIGSTTNGFVHYRFIMDEATPEGVFISVGGDSYGKDETYTQVEIDAKDVAYDFELEDSENDENRKILKLLNTQTTPSTVIASILLPAGGGGAGGVSVMRLRNSLPSNSFTVPYNENGCECIISYTFTSVDSSDNTPTGNGVAYYYIDGDLVLTNQNLPQGQTTIDLGAYVTPNKTNVIRVTVVDMDGNRKSLTYNVNVAYNYIASNFPATSVQNGSFSIACTPNGSGTKTIYCYVDGFLYGNPITTTVSAAARYFDITGLSHGGHTIEIYMTTVLDGYSGSIRSNTLTFGVLQIVPNSEEKLLFVRNTANGSLTQYSKATASYVAYGGGDSTCNLGVDISHKREVTITTKTIDDVVYYNQAELAGAGLSVTAQNPTTVTETVDGVTITYVRKVDTNVVMVDGTDYTPTSPIYHGELSPDSGVVNNWSYRLNYDGIYNVVFSYYYEVENPTGNPVELGYYELSNDSYVLSTDTTVDDTKTYYSGLFQTLEYTATALDVATAETSGLKFLFDPTNRSNNEPASTKTSYSYTNSDSETYTVTFSNIDFNTYGWTGNSLKIPLGGSVSIPYQPFVYDVDTTRGKTIEMSFKISNVYDYEQNVISCFVNNKGINVTANKGNLSINASDSVSVQYNDDTEIRLSFVITKRNADNDYRGQLVYVFVNSDIAGVITYSALDNFIQNPASGITIGSTYAEIELYKVRCYDIELFQVAQDNTSRSYQILNNYIADSPSVEDMLARNARNDVFDETYSIDYNKLPDNCPYMIIECVELSQYKGDKKTVSGYYIDNGNPANSFYFEGAELNVQGTSSQGYYIKNFKIKYKAGLRKETEITTVYIEDAAYIPMSEVGTNDVEITADEPTTITQNDIVYVLKDDTNVVEINGVDYVKLTKYKLYNNSVPTNAFCLKADVASSEGANNIVLMKVWDDMTRWLQDDYDTLTPPQESDARVRQSIDGKPIVVYWKNPNTNATLFWGKYNFNNDKGTSEVFGMTDDENHNCQSWEFRDNGLELTEFKSDDFDTVVSYTDKYTGETSMKPRWWIAFEARFPEEFEDTTKLRRVVSWVASTDTAQATNASLSNDAYYPTSTKSGNPSTLGLYEYSNGSYSATSDTVFNTSKTYYVKYTTDSANYRLAKFEAEFEDYFKKDLTLLYYIFTDIFLMVDSRAKNQFITTFDGTHWMFLPYDGDTALGIDNIGALNFDYWLEDDSLYNGSNVYNGQDSVLWKNVKAVFQTDIKQMINTLVSKGFTYEYVKNKFDNHQSAWSEAIFCADTEHKYIKPYFETGTKAYLAMAQGSKASQRDYWLQHRFIYYMSKYMAGTALTSQNEIQLRMTTPVGVSATYRLVDNPSGNPSTSYYYEKVGTNTYVMSEDTEVDETKDYYIDNSTVIITPFTNTYVIAEFGSTIQQKYCDANESVAFKSTLDSSGDSMFNIYNGTEIKSFGDLSAAYIKRFELGNMATNLESVIVGSETAGYTNEGLVSNMFSLGNSKKLKVVNISNCVNLGGSIQIPNCYNIREFLAKGSQITSVNLPAGSQIRTLKLPSTIVSLSLINQTNLETFEMEGYSNLTSFEVQNTPIDVLNIVGDVLDDATYLNNIKLTDINWSFNQSQNDDGIALMNKLLSKNSSPNGNVQLTGTVHFYEINSKQYDSYTRAWRGLNITYDNFIIQYPVTFTNMQEVSEPTGNPSTLHYYELINDEYVESTDTSVDDEKTYYTGQVLGVVYVNDGETTFDSIDIDSEGNYYSLDVNGNRDTKLFDKPARAFTWDKTYEFNGWDANLGTRIRAPKTFNTSFTETDREYTITFEADSNTLYSVDVTAGDTLTYDTSYGVPSKTPITNTWYLCQGWIDTGEEIVIDGRTDTSRIVGLYATFTVDESLVGDFVADKTTILKPNLILNAIYLECGLPDFMTSPTAADVDNYLSGFDYVYTNDPDKTSAYTLGNLYAICMSNEFDLYLRVGDRAKFVCDLNSRISADPNDSSRSAFEAEVMGFNVYEREDSGFVGVGTSNKMASGDYANEKIKGTFSRVDLAISELTGSAAGLYLCQADGCVYYWNGSSSPTKVCQYFAHVVWSWRFGNSDGTKGQILDATYQMNSGNTTTDGWGNDEANTKCRMNSWLNDGVGTTRSTFSYLPSDLQAIITPVKVLSARGSYIPEGESSAAFGVTPVGCISKLFLLSNAECFGTTTTPYINEIDKWASICTRDSNNELTKITQYQRVTSNNIRLKRPYYGTGSASYWWLRSPISTTFFGFVGTNGYFFYDYASYSYGVSPAFCIG